MFFISWRAFFLAASFLYTIAVIKMNKRGIGGIANLKVVVLVSLCVLQRCLATKEFLPWLYIPVSL